jgi:hypothetical protein
MAVMIGTAGSFVIVLCVIGVVVVALCRRKRYRRRIDETATSSRPTTTTDSAIRRGSAASAAANFMYGRRRTNQTLNYLSPSKAVTGTAKISNGNIYSAVSTTDSYEPTAAASPHQSTTAGPQRKFELLLFSLKSPAPSSLQYKPNNFNQNITNCVASEDEMVKSGSAFSSSDVRCLESSVHGGGKEVAPSWEMQENVFRPVTAVSAMTTTMEQGYPDTAYIGNMSTTQPRQQHVSDTSTDDQRSQTSADDTILLPNATSSGYKLLHSNNIIVGKEDKDVIINPSTTTAAVAELPRELFRFVEKIGEGVFGEVHICEMQRVREYISDSRLTDWLPLSNSGTVLVTLRTLRKFANCHDRNEFDRAVKLLARLNDPNIVQLYGVIRQEEPPASIVVEYLPYGDLRQFLLCRVFDDGSEVRPRDGPPSLSYGCLIYMATQIASGMKYLSELGIVHRDLAARNCLVGSQLKVKVTDYGLIGTAFGGRYSADYCHVDDGPALPVRWMAWESVVLRKFTTRSDVWSFGVTLWELLSFARRQPFDVEFAGDGRQLVLDYVSYFRTGCRRPLPRLPQPRVCPREIYDLMIECWNGDDSQRPTFREIHMFLTRKSMGYRPVATADGSVDAAAAGCGSVNLGAAVDIA